MHQLLLRLLFERTVDVVPYFDGEKLRVIPKGYKAAFNQVRDELLKKMKEQHTEGCLLPAEI